MEPRVLSQSISKALRSFPAIVVTGPRQSGKTTLLRNLFAKTHTFVSLENLDVRIRAKEDPLDFLNEYHPPVIIDEIQYVPELLSYIKTQIDENRKPGQWLFTGSQNFVLMKGVSQSLAGRAAILSLLPFSYTEIIGGASRTQDPVQWLGRLDSDQTVKSKPSLADFILRGGYPELALHRKVDRRLWCGSYISTYLERDIRNLSQMGDLTQFEQFLKMCAIRTGQILNLSDMARDIGISVPTAKRWISILEAGYQVYLLRPYYRNIGKRLVKSPKLYFSDTALASYLLGLHDRNTLMNSPSFPHLFETMVINDVLKRFIHFGQMPAMYYLRTRDGLEVDLVVETGKGVQLFEVKSGMTITSKHASTLLRLIDQPKLVVGGASVISRAKGKFKIRGKVASLNWKAVLGALG